MASEAAILKQEKDETIRQTLFVIIRTLSTSDGAVPREVRADAAFKRAKENKRLRDLTFGEFKLICSAHPMINMRTGVDGTVYYTPKEVAKKHKPSVVQERQSALISSAITTPVAMATTVREEKPVTSPEPRPLEVASQPVAAESQNSRGPDFEKQRLILSALQTTDKWLSSGEIAKLIQQQTGTEVSNSSIGHICGYMAEANPPLLERKYQYGNQGTRLFRRKDGQSSAPSATAPSPRKVTHRKPTEKKRIVALTPKADTQLSRRVLPTGSLVGLSIMALGLGDMVAECGVKIKALADLKREATTLGEQLDDLRKKMDDLLRSVSTKHREAVNQAAEALAAQSEGDR